MKTIHIDLETYSPVSLLDCGLYKYASHPDFRILLVAYAVDDEPVQIADLAAGGSLPWWFLRALSDPYYRKAAHNAAFERVCLSMILRRRSLLAEDAWLDPDQWDCSMAQCNRCGLPASLAEAGAALGLERQKMTEGKKLIQMFCVPGKASVTNPTGDPCSPADYPDQWRTFKDYCVRDVEVERQIAKALSWLPVSEQERRIYALDQRIHDRGVLLDADLCRKAARMDTIHKARLTEEAMQLSGLANPNSIPQLKAWAEERTGRTFESFDKTVVQDLLKTTDDPVLRRVLAIRAETGKTSTSKYPTMLDWECPDGRLHGILQYYGSRTGRWAGRGPQLQNLPKNKLTALGAAHKMLREDDYDGLLLNFGNVPDTLSQLIRTALIAPPLHTFAVCDFSAIEARVLAWLAGEDWVLDVFRSGRDIYCETASNMFHVPVEKHGRNAALRDRGKISVLALGYQGGVSALDAMGGQRLGLTVEEEKETVRRWRDANPNIVRFWASVENAARSCVTGRVPAVVAEKNTSLTFSLEENGTMTILLPSGRKICYPDMHISKEGTLRFHGRTPASNWTWIDTFGGKLTENITQAVARDCLAHAMTLVDQAGFPIVFHVHDEIIAEIPFGTAAFDLVRIEGMFAVPPDWAPTLPLKGAGYLTDYYKKD